MPLPNLRREIKIQKPVVRKLKKKYIFNCELQFLKKIYQERDTEESYNNEDGENGAEEEKREEEQEESVQPVPPEVTTVVGTAITGKKVVSKTKPPTRQHKKMDEVDLKILHALDRKEPVKKNCKLSFFESLLPHVEKFDDNEWLQCQVEFLQVISKIKNKYRSAPQHQDLFHQPAQFQELGQPSHFNYPQPRHYVQMPQQAYSSNMPSHLVQPTSIPAQTKTNSTTGKFQPIQDISQQTGSAALHYENYSQLILDEDIESRSPSVQSLSSSNTIDFTEI